MWQRSFLLANGVIFLDEVLYLALIPLLPVYAAEFDLTRTETGFLYAAYPLLVLIASPPAGLLSERVGGRRMLVAGCGLLVAATIAFAFAQHVWQVWSARAVQGITAGLVATAGMAMIASGAREGRRATTIAVAVSLQGLSALAGYALGGYVTPAIGTTAAFMIPAGIGLIILVALLAYRESPRPATLRVDYRNALLATSRSRAVRASVAGLLAVGIVGGSVQTLASLRLGDEGYSTSQVGTTFVIAALVGFVVTPFAGRAADRRGVVPLTALWGLSTAGLVVVLSLPGQPAWVTAALLVGILPLVRIGGTLAYARGAEYAPLGAGLAIGYGFGVTAWSLGAVVGPIAAGGIADAAGDRVALLAVAGSVALLALVAARPHPSETDSA